MALSLFLGLLSSLASPAPAYTQTPEVVPAASALANAAPEARALWERACAASGRAERAPLTAFQLKAEVLTRTGTGTNEMRIDYRYLAPHCIRFMLPSKNETGCFGPAPEQYWVRQPDGVVPLVGREFKEDRRAVDDMLALARNYVALSNPARLDLRALELSGAPPADLGPELAKRMKKLVWLALESPDFALVKSEAVRTEPALYRVELGLREDHLPAVAIVREKGRSPAAPLLVEFSNYRESDDFKLPFQLLVHALDRSQRPAVFAPKPAQEVYVTSAALRPTLAVADFEPGARK